MGSFDIAEVYELIVQYLLNILKSEFVEKNIRLYRGDNISCLENKSEPKVRKMKSNICKNFKCNGLSNTVESNLHTTKYVDVTFTLKTGKYYPYRKQNNSLQYINKQSNLTPIYNYTMKNSGFNETFKVFAKNPLKTSQMKKYYFVKPAIQQ